MCKRRASTQVLFLRKAELRFFHFFEIVTRWLVPPLVRKSQYSLAGTFHLRRSRLLKTGFFKEVRELKIQRKNSGSAFCLVMSSIILVTMNNVSAFTALSQVTLSIIGSFLKTKLVGLWNNFTFQTSNQQTVKIGNIPSSSQNMNSQF
jgi:hypothetical protein